jgi:hypothetical protein
MRKEIKRARGEIRKIREEASFWDKAIPGIVVTITCVAGFAVLGFPAWAYLAIVLAFIIRMLFWW